MEGCKRHGQVEEYCNCAFEQFKLQFKEADLQQDISKDDPRMKSFEARVKTECATKVPESEVKRQFLEGCVAGEQRKSRYCECAWKDFTKNLSIAELVVADDTSAKWVAARDSMVKACRGTYPKELALAEFSRECAKGDAAKEKYCTCAWKKINQQYTTEEIVAGVADVKKVASLSQCK
jgi:hypothetical protein